MGKHRQYSRDVSPVGWYVGSYLARFVELNDSEKDNPEKSFLLWENTVIVRAGCADEAHEKIATIGEEHARPYKGGPDGDSVQFAFEGVSECLPIYEDLEDGAEIMWTERRRKLKNIRKMRMSKER